MSEPARLSLNKQDAEEAKFQESLLDAAAVVERLSPFCETTSEMQGLLQLAFENKGQLRMVMSVVLKK